MLKKGPWPFLLDWKGSQYSTSKSFKHRMVIQFDLARLTSHSTICVSSLFHPNASDGKIMSTAWAVVMISKKTRIVAGGDMKAGSNRH